MGILYYIIGFCKILYNIITSKLGLCLVFFSRLIMVSGYPIMRDTGTGTSPTGFSERNILLILFTLGNFIFIFINALFDYYSFIITNRTIFNKIILGLLFLFNIILGVFASNGTYYYIHPNYNGILFTLISFVLTILFSSAWFYMSIHPANPNYIIINSTFRAIFEVLTFNAASWFTYDM